MKFCPNGHSGYWVYASELSKTGVPYPDHCMNAKYGGWGYPAAPQSERDRKQYRHRWTVFIKDFEVFKRLGNRCFCCDCNDKADAFPDCECCKKKIKSGKNEKKESEKNEKKEK